MKYWKVVMKYGHVGFRNEVSVARHLRTEDYYSILDARDLASGMPGVKNRGVAEIHAIDEEEYIQGKVMEESNLFLQRLKTFNPIMENLEEEVLHA